MSEPVAPPDRSHDSLRAFLIFAAALLVSLWFTHAGWNNRLFDTHPFRQTQTALSAYWMLRDGIHLDYATPVMGAPWSIPLEFPVYQAAVTGWVRVTGWPLEPAGRAVSLIFFYASLPALWLLLRQLRIPAAQRWLFLALVLTCPVYLFYSRTVLIESTAFCFGAWFLYGFQLALDRRQQVYLLAPAGLGVIAGLAKVTTYAVFLAPAAALGIALLIRQRERWRALLARVGAAALPGVIAAAWWVNHADAVKRRNVLGVTMTSTDLREWNYGPPALRFEPGFWLQFGAHLRNAIAPAGTLLMLAGLALLFLRGRGRLAALLLAIALAGPLVFANLYLIHDYYLYASGILFLALLALPLQQVFADPRVPGLGRWGIVLLVLAAQLSGYLSDYYPRQVAPATEPPELARVLNRATRPDDVILGFGLDWASILPYYSERRALMVPNRYLRDDETIGRAIANLNPLHVGAVVLFRLGQPGPDYFAPWLRKLGMDEIPFAQTGEYTVHLRKDLLPPALQALAHFPFKDVLLYQGRLGPPGQPPPLVYWTDQVADRHRLFSMMRPEPVKVTVPFGLGTELLDHRTVFVAQSTSEIEFRAPPAAHHITATYGLNPAAYALSDGIEVEIVHQAPNSGPQQLYHHYLRPAVIKDDQGLQEISVETVAPLDGSVLFRILPGGSPDYDWAYWAKIEIH